MGYPHGVPTLGPDVQRSTDFWTSPRGDYLPLRGWGLCSDTGDGTGRRSCSVVVGRRVWPSFVTNCPVFTSR